MSPQQLENQWERIYSCVGRGLQKIPLWTLFILLLIVVFTLAPTFKSLWLASYPSWSQIESARFRLPISITLFGVAVMNCLIPLKLQTSYWIVSGILVALSPKLFDPTLKVSLLMGVPLFLLGVYGIHWLNRKYQVRTSLWGALGIVLLFFGIASWIAIQSLKINDFRNLTLFWYQHPAYIFWFSLFYLKMLPRSSAVNLETLYFNPVHLLNPMPWPATLKSISEKERRPLWLQGLVDVLMSQWLFFGLFFYFQTFKLSILSNPWTAPLFTYLPFLIMVQAVSFFTQGCARMLGHNVPSMTHFLWLPRLPSEVWARGNQLVYQMLYQGLFIPLYRQTKRIAVSTALTLAMAIVIMTLFHEIVIRGFYHYSFPQLPSQAWKPELHLLFSGVWWILWLVFFYLSSRLRSFVYQSSLRQWVSILITHLLCAYGFNLCFNWLPRLLLPFLNSPGASK